MLRRSITLLLLLSALTLSGCTLWTESKHVNWTSATGAEQYERMLWQAVEKKDWQSVEAHLASTFVKSSPEGAMDKQQTLAHLHGLEITDYSMGDIHVSPAGNDMVLTYSLLLKGNVPAAPMRVMSVWQQQKKGGWILQAWSQSPAQQPADASPR